MTHQGEGMQLPQACMRIEGEMLVVTSNSNTLHALYACLAGVAVGNNLFARSHSMYHKPLPSPQNTCHFDHKGSHNLHLGHNGHNRQQSTAIGIIVAANDRSVTIDWPKGPTTLGNGWPSRKMGQGPTVILDGPARDPFSVVVLAWA